MKLEVVIAIILLAGNELRYVATSNSEKLLEVSFGSTKADFKISVNGVTWFNEDLTGDGQVMVTSNGQTYSTMDGSLEPSQPSAAVGRGSDILGDFTTHSVRWAPLEIGFETELRCYDHDLIVFTQRFQNGLHGSNLGALPQAADGISTSFPSLSVDYDELGHFSFGGSMAGWVALTVAETWAFPETIRGGQLGGPVAFFDRAYSAVVILSSLNYFMVSSLVTRSRVLDFGLMASIESIPEPGIEMEFVLVAGSSFDEAFSKWGEALRQYHGKSLTTAVDEGRDLARQYLGYWTDNGAYYYYKTLEGLNYEETLIEIRKQMEEMQLPVQYLEIDSWWYFKGPSKGATNWTAMPDLFPNGLDHVQQQAGWPLVAHNRYWSGINDYIGSYNFVVEKDDLNRSIALPQDANFWDDLFLEAKKWGLEMYEQDWLDVQYLLMNVTHQDFYAAHSWLQQMASGAEKSGISIKYCMSLPRQILSSVQFSSAIQAARVSGDYRLSKDNWRIGLSTYLSSSLGLFPFKDTFWSSEINPDHPYYYDCMIGEKEEDPNIPWSISYRYDGPRSETLSGKECITWYDLDLHFNAPNNDLERKACRNAKVSPLFGEGKPWCFTNASRHTDPATWEWESCHIPVCNRDCRRGSGNGDDNNLPECQLIPEPNPRREAIVSLLSRGGVGPGDRLDRLNAGLIMATCRKDGRLLVPDHPAKAAPIQILTMAFSPSHDPFHPHAFHVGEMWTTKTTLNNQYVFTLIFFSETPTSQPLTWRDLGLDHDPLLSRWSHYVLHHYNDDNSQMKVLTLHEIIMGPKLSVNEVALFFLSPVVWSSSQRSDIGLALLGEKDKFVPISRERIKGLSFRQDDALSIVRLLLEGSPSESVTMSFAIMTSLDGNVAVKEVVECVGIIGQTGQAHLRLHVMGADNVTCSSWSDGK